MTTGLFASSKTAAGLGAVFAGMLLCVAPQAGAQIDPRSPESRGGIFIPLDVFSGRDSSDAPASGVDAEQDITGLPTPEAAAVALARVASAAEIASAVRALAAINTEVLPEARDMTLQLAAHLPRYRRSDAGWLHEHPRRRDRTDACIDAESLLVLLSVDDGWHQIYDPATHRVGWLRVPDQR